MVSVHNNDVLSDLWKLPWHIRNYLFPSYQRYIKMFDQVPVDKLSYFLIKFDWFARIFLIDWFIKPRSLLSHSRVCQHRHIMLIPRRLVYIVISLKLNHFLFRILNLRRIIAAWRRGRTAGIAAVASWVIHLVASWEYSLHVEDLSLVLDVVFY